VLSEQLLLLRRLAHLKYTIEYDTHYKWWWVYRDRAIVTMHLTESDAFKCRKDLVDQEVERERFRLTACVPDSAAAPDLQALPG
jgi:hypothetical protein